MKKIKFFIPAVLLLFVIVCGFTLKASSDEPALNANQLPSIGVYVHQEYGYGVVQGCTVVLKDDIGNTVGTAGGPTNSMGYTYIGNGGAPFPTGKYTMYSTNPSVGPGSTNFEINNGYNIPDVHINMGSPY